MPAKHQRRPALRHLGCKTRILLALLAWPPVITIAAGAALRALGF